MWKVETLIPASTAKIAFFRTLTQGAARGYRARNGYFDANGVHIGIFMQPARPNAPLTCWFRLL